MVSAVGSVGSTPTAVAPSGAAPATQAESASTPTTSSGLPPLSPRGVVDTLSGTMITEYLDNSGNLTTQVPSSAAIAYMRMGLTEDGRSDNVEGGVVA